MSSLIGKICAFVPVIFAAVVAGYGEYEDSKQKEEIKQMKAELEELKAEKEKEPETEEEESV